MSAQELLDALVGAQELRAEVARLRAVEQWAVSQQPFAVGDAVVIKDAPVINRERAWGWMASRGFLVEGCTGVITDVLFNSWSGRWGVLFKPDVQWIALSDDRCVPEHRPANFHFDPARLRKRKKKDRPLALPDEVARQLNGGAA